MAAFRWTTPPVDMGRRLDGDGYDSGSISDNEAAGNVNYADAAEGDGANSNGDRGGDEQARANGNDGDLELLFLVPQLHGIVNTWDVEYMVVHL